MAWTYIDGNLLVGRLPRVRGEYLPDVDLAKATWFRVGGPAEVLFKPADLRDLADFVARKPVDIPVTVIGMASNLMIRDGGIPGVVIRLGREFANLTVKGLEMRVGAGALDNTVAQTAADSALSGLEFLSGIPGAIGGALRMNAGAFGTEMKDVVISAQAVDASGTVRELPVDQLGFAYRTCSVPENWIFTEARLQCRPGQRIDIERRMRDIRLAREANQPSRIATGGSTFKNPPNGSAWELIDKAGCRGLTVGGAQVSEQHCNFLINTGNATAADLEALGEEVRRRVLEASGVELEWEIRRIGIPAPQRPGRGMR